MFKKFSKSLTTKLIVQISSTVLIIYTIVFGYNYFESRKQISAYAEMHCKRVAESTANLIESTMHESERAAIDSIPVLLNNINDMALIKTLIEMIVRQNEIFQGAILITEDSGKTHISHTFAIFKNVLKAVYNHSIFQSNSVFNNRY